MKGRSWRFVVAAAAALLAALPVAPTFAEEESEDRLAPYRAGTVTNVESLIDESTPMYYLKLRFTIDVTRCPAVLDFKLAGGTSSGNVCGVNDTPPLTTVVDVLRPVFGSSGNDLNPNGVDCDGGIEEPDVPGCQIKTFVRDSSVWTSPNEAAITDVFPEQVDVPDAPRWIGVGDGYTSKRTQTSDACYTPSLLGTASCTGQTLTGDDRAQSWINTAVISLNSSLKVDGQTIPSGWRIAGYNVARDAIAESGQVEAAELGSEATDAYGQVAQVSAILTEGARKPSWDWVGVSAGLEDTGIPQKVRATYGTYTGASNTVYPWNATTVSECPALPTTVSPDVADGIRAGLSRVISAAKGASAGVRVVLVQYPYLTEVQSTVIDPGKLNVCAAADTDGDRIPDNREGVDALNGVIGDVVKSGLSNVYALDLRATCPPPAGVVTCGFGDEPTGTGSSRAESYLQLTRPWGYPYPSRSGAEFLGNSAGMLARSLTAGPPAIEARVVKVVDGKRVVVTAPNGWYGGSGLYVEWYVRPGEEGAGGVVITPDASEHPVDGLVPMREGKLVTYRATAVDAKGQTVEESQVFPYDPRAPQLTATPSSQPNGAGWYGTSNKPTVTFSMSDPWPTNGRIDDASGADPATLAVVASRTAPDGTVSSQQHGPGSPSVSVPITASGTYSLTGSGQDLAQNSAAPVTLQLKADYEAPTVAVVPATTTWSKTDVAVTYDARDTGGSNVAAVLDAPNVITAEGRTQITATVTDRAGNTGTGTGLVRIDRTAPNVTVTGAEDGATYSFDADDDVDPPPSSVGCEVVDVVPAGLTAADVSGAGTCSTSRVRQPVDGGVAYTVTASGTDVAGNTDTSSITYTVVGFEPVTDGRMTVGGTHAGATGTVTTSGTLRCNGSPNRLTVSWSTGSLTLDHVDSITCINDAELQEQPQAFFDTLMGVGSGTLAGGGRANVEFTFVDGGEPGTRDAADLVIKTPAGHVLLDSAGTLTGGNFQAHRSQGQGTNNNGCLNGPNGSSCSNGSATPLRPGAY